MRPLRVLTWHIHGNYLYYLSKSNLEIYIPHDRTHREGYGGKGTVFPFGPNVHEVPTSLVPRLDIDCILYQTRMNFEHDRYVTLSQSQRALPQIFLEHNPPSGHPTQTHHCVSDPNILVVHVTPFNQLMWDCGAAPTRVIEHGVYIPSTARATGEFARGITVFNHLFKRGRAAGADLFERARQAVPIDLVGMDSEPFGGLGEVLPPLLPSFIAPYRFAFHPTRYTSLGLSVIEAMTVGLPVVGLATTELVTCICNGETGFIDTDLERLTDVMRQLLEKPDWARSLGEAARAYALKRFHIDRFTSDWEKTVAEVVGGFRGKQREWEVVLDSHS